MEIQPNQRIKNALKKLNIKCRISCYSIDKNIIYIETDKLGNQNDAIDFYIDYSMNQICDLFDMFVVEFNEFNMEEKIIKYINLIV